MLRTQKTFVGDGRQAVKKSHYFPFFNVNGLSFEKILDLWPKTRSSNPVSKILRPMFEHKNIHKILGSQLAVLTLITGATSVPVSALGVIPAGATYSNSIEVTVQTNKTVVYPLAHPLGMSQGFSVFHQAVDIRAPLGSDIYPVASGKVTLVAMARTGYGHRVEVTHSDGKMSLYAHMGKIYVEEGEEITTATTLGQVGMTGHTTGPHLHLEVMENGKKTNPLNMISK